MSTGKERKKKNEEEKLHVVGNADLNAAKEG